MSLIVNFNIEYITYIKLFVRIYFNLKYNTSVFKKIPAIFFEIKFEEIIRSSELLAIKAILSKHTPPAIPAMPQKTSFEYLNILSKIDYLPIKLEVN